MTTSTDPRTLALRSLDFMATGAEADFHTVVHPEATNREAIDEPPACRVPGPAGFYATALWLRAAYSDLRWEVHEVVADGDLVVVRTTMSGRHTGPFVTYDADGGVEQAFPPTGRSFATTQTHWFRIADGLIVEHWANRDDLGTAKQLAWVPPTPAYLFRMARATRAARRAEGKNAR
ncbi:ester cyclase [Nocardia sp. NPDC057227]|uniref:ester cyclase n=1 Tax=Nocardia sp. NPDC057227 TaxID=3346056 RepID=UPI00362DDD1E